jgi:hypothetical protein
MQIALWRLLGATIAAGAVLMSLATIACDEKCVDGNGHEYSCPHHVEAPVEDTDHPKHPKPPPRIPEPPRRP